MPTVKPNSEFKPSDWPEAARSILESLSDYTRPRAPSQPSGLPFADTLGQLMQAARDGRKLNDQDRDTVEIFGAWRERVFAVESQSAANLAVLLALIQHLEQPNGELTEDSIRVRKHIRDQGWGWPPRVVDDAVVKWLPEYRAQDTVLGSEMRGL